MKSWAILDFMTLPTASIITVLTATALLAADRVEKNPIIDYEGFLNTATKIQGYRDQRLISETQFLSLSKLPGTVILDTRSADKFAKIHVKGAVHLNFSEITEQALAKLIPDKNTRILTYCNNNFEGDPINFESKTAVAALNIPTFITLYSYGYRNLYELEPLLDVETTAIPFAKAPQ